MGGSVFFGKNGKFWVKSRGVLVWNLNFMDIFGKDFPKSKMILGKKHIFEFEVLGYKSWGFVFDFFLFLDLNLWTSLENNGKFQITTPGFLFLGWFFFFISCGHTWNFQSHYPRRKWIFMSGMSQQGKHVKIPEIFGIFFIPLSRRI